MSSKARNLISKVQFSKKNITFAQLKKARMAKLVDAHDSGSCVSNDMQVRFLFRALKMLSPKNFHSFSSSQKIKKHGKYFKNKRRIQRTSAKLL